MENNPYIKQAENTPSAISDSLGTFNTNDFIKGALIGAAATYLLTNEKAQKAIFKTFAKGSQMLQAGVEEIKERIEDAKAELEASQQKV